MFYAKLQLSLVLTSFIVSVHGTPYTCTLKANGVCLFGVKKKSCDYEKKFAAATCVETIVIKQKNSSYSSIERKESFTQKSEVKFIVNKDGQTELYDLKRSGSGSDQNTTKLGPNIIQTTIFVKYKKVVRKVILEIHTTKVTTVTFGDQSKNSNTQIKFTTELYKPTTQLDQDDNSERLILKIQLHDPNAVMDDNTNVLFEVEVINPVSNDDDYKLRIHVIKLEPPSTDDAIAHDSAKPNDEKIIDMNVGAVLNSNKTENGPQVIILNTETPSDLTNSQENDKKERMKIEIWIPKHVSELGNEQQQNASPNKPNEIITDIRNLEKLSNDAAKKMIIDVLILEPKPDNPQKMVIQLLLSQTDGLISQIKGAELISESEMLVDLNDLQKSKKTRDENSKISIEMRVLKFVTQVNLNAYQAENKILLDSKDLRKYCTTRNGYKKLVIELEFLKPTALKPIESNDIWDGMKIRIRVVNLDLKDNTSARDAIIQGTNNDANRTVLEIPTIKPNSQNSDANKTNGSAQINFEIKVEQEALDRNAAQIEEMRRNNNKSVIMDVNDFNNGSKMIIEIRKFEPKNNNNSNQKVKIAILVYAVKTDAQILPNQGAEFISKNPILLNLKDLETSGETNNDLDRLLIEIHVFRYASEENFNENLATNSILLVFDNSDKIEKTKVVTEIRFIKVDTETKIEVRVLTTETLKEQKAGLTPLKDTSKGTDKYDSTKVLEVQVNNTNSVADKENQVEADSQKPTNVIVQVPKEVVVVEVNETQDAGNSTENSIIAAVKELMKNGSKMIIEIRIFEPKADDDNNQMKMAILMYTSQLDEPFKRNEQAEEIRRNEIVLDLNTLQNSTGANLKNNLLKIEIIVLKFVSQESFNAHQAAQQIQLDAKDLQEYGTTNGIRNNVIIEIRLVKIRSTKTDPATEELVVEVSVLDKNENGEKLTEIAILPEAEDAANNKTSEAKPDSSSKNTVVETPIFNTGNNSSTDSSNNNDVNPTNLVVQVTKHESKVNVSQNLATNPNNKTSIMIDVDKPTDGSNDNGNKKTIVVRVLEKDNKKHIEIVALTQETSEDDERNKGAVEISKSGLVLDLGGVRKPGLDKKDNKIEIEILTLKFTSEEHFKQSVAVDEMNKSIKNKIVLDSNALEQYHKATNNDNIIIDIRIVKPAVSPKPNGAEGIMIEVRVLNFDSILNKNNVANPSFKDLFATPFFNDKCPKCNFDINQFKNLKGNISQVWTNSRNYSYSNYNYSNKTTNG